MALSPQRWKRVTESAFRWEAEARLHPRTPPIVIRTAVGPIFFISDSGSVNELDALIATPRGLFLVEEIKSDDGVLRGDRGTWTFHKSNGWLKTVDNRLLGADRKCKKLKSLLERQPACKGESLPFIESLVFLSNPELSNQLPETDRIRTCQRDRDNASGITSAFRFRKAPTASPRSAFPPQVHRVHTEPSQGSALLWRKAKSPLMRSVSMGGNSVAAIYFFRAGGRRAPD